jgi:hypothetical protein
MSEDNESKIRVKDRRMFNLDGSLRPQDPDEAPTREPERVVEPTAAAAAPAEARDRGARERGARDNVVSLDGRERAAEPAEQRRQPAPEPSPLRTAEATLFQGLVESLAVQAAMFMGLMRDPLGPQMPTDLGAARQMIDMLAMLREKTRGNLTPEEMAALERILNDLRMQYVTMSRGKGK